MVVKCWDGWDESVPIRILTTWDSFIASLPELNQLEIPLDSNSTVFAMHPNALTEHASISDP
jgi:hypothetical protein